MPQSSKESNESQSPRQSTGVIYSYTIVHVGFGHMADKAPYALCQVEVNEDEIVLGVCLDKESIPKLAINLTVKLETNKEFGFQVLI